MRLKWLSYFAEHDKNLSKTCRHFGISRSTFRRWLRRFDPEDARSLEAEAPRPRPRAVEPDLHVVAFVRACRVSEPYVSSADIAKRLLSERGIVMSPATVGRMIQRHGFFFGDSAAHLRKREEAADFGRTQLSTPASDTGSSLPDDDEAITSAFPVFGS